MNQFEYIQLVNPEWANKISDFVSDNPEFLPYIYVLPISPTFRIPYKNVNTVFQAVLFYMCMVGVRMDYIKTMGCYLSFIKRRLMGQNNGKYRNAETKYKYPTQKEGNIPQYLYFYE